MESQKKHKPQFSIEFFPPKTEEGKIKLRKTREELAKLNPAYFSVTYGAGGSTQQGTLDTVLEIKKCRKRCCTTPDLHWFNQTRCARAFANVYR